MEQIFDLIIIGSGPAGMTAAVYATRAEMRTLILENNAPGGKMVKTHLVENYPGFDSITGVDLSIKMHTHSTAFGAVYQYGDVTNISKGDPLFSVTTADGSVYQSKAVIAATGTIERKLGLEHEDELVGKGVSYCAVCDGAFFKNRDVIVIGGGNSAIDESIYLTQFVNKVTVVMRRDVFRADLGTVEVAKRNPKIEFLYHYTPQEILVENGLVAGLRIKSTQTDETRDVSGAAIFPYIGADPATSYLTELDILDEDGYSIVNDMMETSIPGLFTIGDMNQKQLRQIVTATSDGAIAAQQAIAYITKEVTD